MRSASHVAFQSCCFVRRIVGTGKHLASLAAQRDANQHRSGRNRIGARNLDVLSRRYVAPSPQVTTNVPVCVTEPVLVSSSAATGSCSSPPLQRGLVASTAPSDGTPLKARSLSAMVYDSARRQIAQFVPSYAQVSPRSRPPVPSPRKVLLTRGCDAMVLFCCKDPLTETF